jgi:hypothetical protein
LIPDRHECRNPGAAESASGQERIESLRMFATNLEKAFYGFESDFFRHNWSASLKTQSG